ncbi:MAG: GNAT family N-acetyltransferase [Gilvibacter sp.]
MIGGLLHTKRLILTRLCTDDIALIHTLNSYPEVAAYNTIGIPKDLETTAKVCKTHIEQLESNNPTHFAWIIRDTDSEAFIGEIGLTLSVERFKKGEIFFNLLPETWGRGFASEAAIGVIKFAFNELDLHRIEAGVAVLNGKSIALLERLGMQREGRHRKILPLAMGWTDNYSYAILKEDWDAHKTD